MSAHTRGEADRAIDGPARQRRHGDGHLAHPRPPDLRDRAARDEAPRDPAHRRRQRGRDARSRCRPRSASCVGAFQCDCRGVGDQWRVDEVRGIASALLGTVDLIPAPEEMAAEFEAMMRASMSRGVANSELRVWVPQGAELLFVKQVVADARGPHVAAHRRQPAHRRLPDRRVVRREPRLPRGRPPAGPHARPGAARGPRAVLARRRPRRPGPRQGQVEQRRLADDPHRPRGRRLHRAGRARHRHPGGPRGQGRRPGRRRDRRSSAGPSSSPTRPATTR